MNYIVLNNISFNYCRSRKSSNHERKFFPTLLICDDEEEHDLEKVKQRQSVDNKTSIININMNTNDNNQITDAQKL